jgi:hypothetical protein
MANQRPPAGREQFRGPLPKHVPARDHQGRPFRGRRADNPALFWHRLRQATPDFVTVRFFPVPGRAGAAYYPLGAQPRP